jgi:hypothetical protein
MNSAPAETTRRVVSSERRTIGLGSALDALDHAVQAYADDGRSTAAGAVLRQARRDVACQMAGARGTLREGTEEARRILRMLHRLAAEGLLGLPTEAADLDLAGTMAESGWRARLGRILIVPCWQDPEPASFAALPHWLWGAAAGWMFQTAAFYPAAGDQERHVEIMQAGLEELFLWRERNAGSFAVREAFDAVAAHFQIGRLQGRGAFLRPLKELHARLICCRNRPSKETYESVAFLRLGRPLRIGCILRGAGDGDEARAMVSLFAGLDGSRFELFVYTMAAPAAPVVQRLQGSPATLQVLSSRPLDQVETLRGAGLDAVLFGLDRPALTDPVTHLAAFRVAPLQVVNDCGWGSTGLPEIDLCAMASTAEDAPPAAEFTERLGLLPLTPRASGDPLAWSLAWGGLIEAAYDSLADTDRTRFRASREPFIAGSAAEAARLTAEMTEHFQAERFAEAAAAGRHLLGMEPTNLPARAMVGRALAAAGEFAAARRYLFCPANEATFTPGAWAALGAWLQHRGAWPLAMEALHASLRANPAQPAVWRRLADLAEERGAADTADQARKLAIAHERPTPAG